MSIKTLITFEELRSQRLQWLREGKKVAFVPTMGALHDGHLSLVRLAKAQSDITVVSIFVNPMQFGPKEDFSKYPRTLEADMEKLASVSVDMVFLPTAFEIYPEHFQTTVINTKSADILCGKFRPGHFQGVLTVVLKLFNLVQPDVAVFGKKDYQQLMLIKTMVRDLNLSLQILAGETTREADGMAMSSRNRYLSPEEREAAKFIFKSLAEVREIFSKGERQAPALLATFAETLKKSAPTLRLEYHAIVAQDNLSILDTETLRVPAVMCVAVFAGKTRLIDNVELTP